MRRFTTLAVVAGIAITACSGSDADGITTTAPAPGADVARTTSIPTPDTTPETTAADDAPTGPVVESTDEPARDPSPSVPVSEADLVNFLASVETAIEGTRYQGVVFQEPETYIALAQVACARFSDGHTVDEIAEDMLGAIDEVDSTDEERLVGAILGAATRTICPEHSDKI